jgi:hypothetical protein
VLEKEMEDLIADHPNEFFPRHGFTLQGRQGHFQEVGRYDLLFADEFGTQVLMELKAVPAKYENATQLAKYYVALLEKKATNIQMWLVAPSIPRPVRDFLDQIGIEYTEIHEAEYRKVAARHGYTFTSEGLVAPAAKEKIVEKQESEPIPAAMPPVEAPTVVTPTEEVFSLDSVPVSAASQIDVAVEMRGEEVVLKFNDREYCARGTWRNRGKDVLRVNLRVMSTNANGDMALHVDTLELTASRQRMAFIKQTAKEFGIKEEIIRHEMGMVLLKLEGLRDAQLNDGIDNLSRTPQSIQNAELLKCLRRYVNSPFHGVWIKAHRVTQEMHSNHIVNYAYIQHNMANITCFRKSAYPSQALKRCIEDALHSGILSRVKTTRTNAVLYMVHKID